MRTPVLAVGDGALGFWKAICDVFPETREQRLWWHKIANVLAALPKSAHPGHEGGRLTSSLRGDGIQVARVRPTRWRAVNAPHLVAFECAGAPFHDGKLIARPDESGGDQHAA